MSDTPEPEDDEFVSLGQIARRLDAVHDEQERTRGSWERRVFDAGPWSE